MVRHPLLLKLAFGVAIFMLLLSLLLPTWLSQWQAPLAIALILLLGVPHGATDYQLFRFWRRQGRPGLGLFLLPYLLLMGLYGLLWAVAPGLSLGIFLLASAYHFGQSNWVGTADLPAGLREALYLLWGAYVLAGPILLHAGEAQQVIDHMLGPGQWSLVAAAGWTWPLALLGALGILLTGLYLAGKLSAWRGRWEALNLLVLTGLFAGTPLLIGFTAYFVFWHSLGSVRDQVLAFRAVRPGYGWGAFVRETLPFTLVSLLALAGVASLDLRQDLMAYTGHVFIFISLVTLPHMILMEGFFQVAEVPAPAA